MLVQQVSGKIIGTRNPTVANVHTPLNWAIYTVIEVLSSVVPVEGLFCLEETGPRAIGSGADKSPGGTSVGAAITGYNTGSN